MGLSEKLSSPRSDPKGTDLENVLEDVLEARASELGRRLDRWGRAIDVCPPLVRTREFVEQRLPDGLTAEEAAAEAHLERHYFSAYFHERVGVTFLEWLNAMRLARALKLLEEESVKVTELAESSGFLTTRHLQRVFRRYLGSTPTRYRRLVRSQRAGE
jgi:AraC-like DNA-binding protein